MNDLSYLSLKIPTQLFNPNLVYSVLSTKAKPFNLSENKPLYIQWGKILFRLSATDFPALCFWVCDIVFIIDSLSSILSITIYWKEPTT